MSHNAPDALHEFAERGQFDAAEQLRRQQRRARRRFEEGDIHARFLHRFREGGLPIGQMQERPGDKLRLQDTLPQQRIESHEVARNREGTADRHADDGLGKRLVETQCHIEQHRDAPVASRVQRLQVEESPRGIEHVPPDRGDVLAFGPFHGRAVGFGLEVVNIDTRHDGRLAVIAVGRRVRLIEQFRIARDIPRRAPHEARSVFVYRRREFHGAPQGAHPRCGVAASCARRC